MFSSIYGKNVVDNAYYQGVKYENKGRQYDSFREFIAMNFSEEILTFESKIK